MSDAAVTFESMDGEQHTSPGKEALFSFACPRHPGRRCESLAIAGRVPWKRSPTGQNGGTPQWDWDGNSLAPTFTPSIDCKGCWHGFIRAGRCVNTNGADEPTPVAAAVKAV